MRPASKSGVEHETLHWAAGSVGFELASPDPSVVERARVVLGPWLNGVSAAHPLKARFLVEAAAPDAGGRWRVVMEGSDATTVDTLDLALAAVEYRSIVELLDTGSGVVALHAALLSKDGRGVLLVGPKEAGKSTLACALWRAGWHFHSDDSALLEDSRRARGVPRRVSLRPTSRALLGADLWDRIASLPATTRTTAGGLLFHPCEASRGDRQQTAEIAAVIFLARLGSTTPAGEIEALDGARALLALWPYSHGRDAGIGAALQSLQPLADRVPMFDLGRGELATMVERVEEVVGT
ncbi:MAG TPA: hypothetical protein VFS53_05600 [Gemmatimonadota bacterium]|nr:hypothetical protein [Gemmatimonadota bacterium]